MPAQEPKIFTGTVSQRFADEDRVATVTCHASNSGELATRMENAERVLHKMIERHNAKVLDTGEIARERVIQMKAEIEHAYAKRLVEAGLLPTDFLPREVNGADTSTGTPHARADS